MNAVVTKGQENAEAFSEAKLPQADSFFEQCKPYVKTAAAVAECVAGAVKLAGYVAPVLAAVQKIEAISITKKNKDTQLEKSLFFLIYFATKRSVQPFQSRIEIYPEIIQGCLCGMGGSLYVD